MIPFDYERAVAGDSVMTHQGDPVRILCFDRKNADTPIVALVTINGKRDEVVQTYTPKGRAFSAKSSVYDLVMVPPVKWVNVYWDSEEQDTFLSDPYSTQENANRSRDSITPTLQFLGCFEVPA